MSLLLLKQPWAVSWMWPLPWGDFLPAGVTLFMCLHFQAVCLGTAQLLLGWDVGGSRGRLLPWPPHFPRGCWFSRSAVAELHGKRDVIVGPAGKWWETEPLISRAWGSVEGQSVARCPSLPARQLSLHHQLLHLAGSRQWLGHTPGSVIRHQTMGVPMGSAQHGDILCLGQFLCSPSEM